MGNGVVIAVGVVTAVGVGATGVVLGRIDARVGGKGVGVDGTGVEAGAHPLSKAAIDTNARRTDAMRCFMTLSPP